jgi:hypothetical protein
VLRAVSEPGRAWRRVTAGRRPLPDFIILGAQRGGTTSLYNWLMGHPSVVPPSNKEVHYFDLHYARGLSWYRTHFPLARAGQVTGEASPYLLFHPLAPARVAADLPPTTRFIVILRDPVQRAVSHYWHERRLKAETEPLDVALAMEEQRLSGADEQVLRGERSFAHYHFSYAARGRYAEQLARWFDHVSRSRLLVVESESLFGNADAQARVTEWLGLSDTLVPFPAMNEAPRADPTDSGAVDMLERYFEPRNEELFDLLGYQLWRK